MAPARELRGMGFLDALKTEAGLDSFSQHILLVQGSGRNWKEPSQRASSVKNPILTSSWEKKMQQKAAHQRYKEVKQAAIDVRKQKLQVFDMLGTAKCSLGRHPAAQQHWSQSFNTGVPCKGTTHAGADACKQKLQVT